MAEHSASSPDQSIALSTLLQLIEDYHSFNPGGVPRHPYPTSLDFSKQVNRGRPCVYRLEPHPSTRGIHPDDHQETAGPNTTSGQTEYLSELDSIKSCPAWSWTKDSLCAKVRDDVEVAVTPDGRADSLYHLPRQSSLPGGNAQDRDQDQDDEEGEQVFVQPATLSMPLSSLLDKLCPTPPPMSSSTGSHLPSQKAIYYLQSQNSNLTNTSLSPLLTELPANLPFARSVLGDPEATNIWIGNAASVTSTHRDPYENLYLVLKGSKTFTLWAPCEELCLHAQKVRTAHLVHVNVHDHDHDHDREHHLNSTTSDPSFKIVLDHVSPIDDTNTNTNAEIETDTDTRIPWIPIDPLNPPTPSVLASQYPFYRYCHPLTATVSAGEMLYLPAGWFHHVTQECGVWADGGRAPCIAVNYWFDMDYEGEKYAMREMVGRLVETVNRNTA